MTDLYRLVYTSRNLVGGDGDEQERTIARIVDASRRNNGRAGVTGALLFSPGSFAQVLEGPRIAVEETFERIQRDHRHGGISVLQCESVAECLFSGWSMAFASGSARERVLLDGTAGSPGFDLGRLDGDGICAALLAMVRGDGAVEPAPQAPGLDVDRLRSALAAETPGYRAASAVDSPAARASAPPAPVAVAPASAAGPDVTDRVLRSALDAERERTTTLRRDLDEVHIALARSEGDTEALGRHRDIWADRSAQMRTSLKEARVALGAAEAERDALRERAAAHAADVDILRVQRDIWAERARALAAALCRDPMVERAEAAGAPLPAAERVRPPLVKVAS